MKSLYSNPDLNNKYQQNSSFKQLMISNQKNYQQKLQQSFYSDLSKVNPKFIQITSQFIDQTNFNGSKIYSQRKHIIYVYSHFQPQNPTELHKYFLYFIHSFQQPKQPFHLIYVNTTQGGKGKCWPNFKNVILYQLPLKYLLFMEKLVLIRPSFLDKASSIVQFGVQNKFFANKLQKYDSLKSYFQTIGKKFDDIKKSMPVQVSEQEPNQYPIKKSSNLPTFICNFNENRTSYDLNQLNEQQMPQLKKLKSQKNNQLKQIKKKGLQNYPTGQLGIPLALQLLIFYFTQIPIRCQKQGLFRKCTSIDDQKMLIKQLQNQHYEVLTAIDNQIAVGSTLKRFLGNLQPPMIPYENYQRLTANISLESLQKQINSFPIINFMSLMHVLKFLKQFIIPNSKKNLMSIQNVAICFAPCFMKSKQITQRQILLASINVKLTKLMIQNFQSIFGDNQQQKRISRKTYKIFRRSSKSHGESQSRESSNSKASQQNTPDKSQQNINNQVQIKIHGSKVQCHQIFLKPISTIFQDEGQSQFQKHSEKSGQYDAFQEVQIKNQNLLKAQTISKRQNKREQNMQNCIQNKEKQRKQKQENKLQVKNSMRKHKSYKRLPFKEESEIQNTRKSDCDAESDIAEQQIMQMNTQNIQRLNKLRVNRSKMGNK